MNGFAALAVDVEGRRQRRRTRRTLVSSGIRPILASPLPADNASPSSSTPERWLGTGPHRPRNPHQMPGAEMPRGRSEHLGVASSHPAWFASRSLRLGRAERPGPDDGCPHGLAIWHEASMPSPFSFEADTRLGDIVRLWRGSAGLYCSAVTEGRPAHGARENRTAAPQKVISKELLRASRFVVCCH
jgi:hypothetical protein